MLISTGTQNPMIIFVVPVTVIVLYYYSGNEQCFQISSWSLSFSCAYVGLSDHLCFKQRSKDVWFVMFCLNVIVMVLKSLFSDQEIVLVL